MAVFAAAAAVLFGLECQSPSQSHYELIDDDDDSEMCTLNSESPEVHANLFSRLFFSWMSPLIETGFKRPLQLGDIWELDSKYRPSTAAATFQQHWQAQIKSGKLSLATAAFYAYGWDWVLASLIYLMEVVVPFLEPIMLSRLIGFVAKYNTPMAEPIENGYFYSAAMFAAAAIEALATRQRVLQGRRIDCLVKSGLMTAIFRKTMALSNDACQVHNIGSIVSHTTIDTNRMVNFIAYRSSDLWSIPLQIVIALYLLYQTLGWSMGFAILVMFLGTPISAYLIKIMRSYSKQMIEYCDKRVKITEELLAGIKIIKLYAWESPFVQRLNHVRVNCELEAIRMFGVIQTYLRFEMSLIPFIVTFTAFSVYSLFDNVSHGPLNPQLVFVSISLFKKLQYPIDDAAGMFSTVLDFQISFNRIYKFLTADELDFTAIDRAPYDRDSADSSADDVLVKIDNGSFRWRAQEEDNLCDINLQCRRQELVAVVGRVGSGKSSLVSAILGDMFKCSGTVATRGSVAYVPQQPWILNATLRDNILFGNQFEPELYDRVVDACALRQDFKMLPDGDKTEIGEKGINLSGGQKARVSLARAVYARGDVYVLDDPLAAVDAHVGKHIFQHVLGPTGLLQTRARILVTNALQYLPAADNIYLLQEGTVVEEGTLTAAMANKGPIYEYVHQHIGQSHTSAPSSTTVSDTEEDNLPLAMVGLKSAPGPRKQSLGRANIEDIGCALARYNNQVAQGESSGSAAGAGRTMTVETNEKGQVKWEVYRTYFQASGMSNIAILAAVVVASAVIGVCANLWLKHWASSNSQVDGASFFQLTQNHSITYYLLIYGALGLFGAVMDAMISFMLWTRVSIIAAKHLHQDMLTSILRSPMSFFDTTPVGRILNRFTADLDHCDVALPYNMYRVVSTATEIVSSFVVISMSTPLIFAVMLPLVYFYKYLQQRYIASSRELKRIISTTRSPVVAHFQESIGGVATIRAYGLQSRFLAENENRIEQNVKASYTSVSLNQWLSLRLEMLGSLVLLGTTTMSIITLQLFGYGDAGLVGLAVTYAISFTSSVNGSVRTYTELENSMTQLERVKEYTNLTPEAPATIEDNTPQDVWPEQGLLEFKNYSTRYRDGLDLVLNNLSFRVEPRQKVGIVGRTGAGKSSLTLALFRIIEAAEGQILLDGQDISQYGLFDLRSRLSIIPQDPVLFAGTVRENLDPFSQYTDQEIWNALEHAHLAEFIRTKADRLEFEVTQGGENLSVGQRQLICLARALLKRAKILVLDEATAAIDSKTDAIIQQSIRREFQDCTVLTIAHRINTIMDSDMVLVVDQGKVGEYDTPANLLQNKDGLFAQLVEESQQSESE
ncbi:hypothetical protein GGF46_004212 [Coemansia sp. RSA 552]|nr:hypothetical protein GGF46_004212 [Coemansia sp. RSA 552]